MTNESPHSKRERIPIWVWLVIALPVVGLVVIAATVPNRNHISATFFGPLPPDDAKLVSWLEEQPGISSVRVSRKGEELELRYRTRMFGNRGRAFIAPPWSDLGYGLPSSFSLHVSPGWLPGH